MREVRSKVPTSPSPAGACGAVRRDSREASSRDVVDRSHHTVERTRSQAVFTVTQCSTVDGLRKIPAAHQGQATGFEQREVHGRIPYERDDSTKISSGSSSYRLGHLSNRVLASNAPPGSSSPSTMADAARWKLSGRGP